MLTLKTLNEKKHSIQNVLYYLLRLSSKFDAEAPLKTFFKGESKIGLKCNKRALITSELGGVARRNFGT